jgi:6-pyruvoyltetrahydropterin/6-carboxytetrahydropterin synthase
MVVDFYDLKWLIEEAVIERWDHAFLVWCEDHKMLRALEHLEDWQRTVVTGMPPTVEYLAYLAFSLIDGKVDWYLGGLRERVLRQVVLHETATSRCTVTREQYEAEKG